VLIGEILANMTQVSDMAPGPLVPDPTVLPGEKYTVMQYNIYLYEHDEILSTVCGII
jgi:hypothetical protein